MGSFCQLLRLKICGKKYVAKSIKKKIKLYWKKENVSSKICFEHMNALFQVLVYLILLGAIVRGILQRGLSVQLS